eukprot:SAG31_NODE_13336_length_876_cov_1.021879_1_plen_104_part_10
MTFKTQDPGPDWASVSFDDSAWPVAVSGGTNGAAPWGMRPDIPANAHWIWASSLMNTDEVWCRIATGSHAYDDGLYQDGASDGQVHVCADDATTIYVNGNRIGS